MMRIASHATWMIVAAFLGGVGCGFSSNATVVDGATRDGPGGSDGNGGPDASCAWALHFDACALPSPPSSELVLAAGTWTFDTTGAGSLSPAPTSGSFDPRGAVAQTGGPDVQLIWVKSLSILPTATLLVIGDKPLIIASDTTIAVQGTIDASSKFGGQTGAGANPPGCASHEASPGVTGANAGGGGGGGGMNGRGGSGGNGDGDAGGNGGVSIAPSPPTVLVGGCAGAHGGLAGGGASGDGGGAIELAARGSISITGIVTTGGSGGEGGGQTGDKGGGGGGGSGGVVSLDARSVTLAPTAVLASNGGGAGGGGKNGAANPGGDGAPSAAAAAGGTGPSQTGGRGGNRTNPNGQSLTATSSDGGGGGGGGVGFVMMKLAAVTDQGATISPAPSNQ